MGVTCLKLCGGKLVHKFSNLEGLFIKAAGVSVEPFWPGLFASALTGVDVTGLITKIGSGVGSGAPAATAAAGDETAPAEEAKKESSEEEDSDSEFGFDIFGGN